MTAAATIDSLAQLLVVEDDPALPEFRCSETDLPLWPQIRAVFLRMVISDLFYATAVTGRSATRMPLVRAASTLCRSALHNIGLRVSGRDRARVCITADGVADQWTDGRWFNRLGDHFALACGPQTLVVADHFEWRWPFPRHHERLLLHAPQQACNAIAGRIAVRSAHRDTSRRLVERVADRARRLLGWSPGRDREDRLAQMLARKSAALPSQYRAYRATLRRIEPRVLLVAGGCYGPAAALIAAARELGIVTAEYQHGAISAGHDAYNFAPAILESAAYRRTLPDHFLGYGAWWNDQINAPIAKLAIGNPHRTARLAESVPRDASFADLLFLSDGVEFEQYLALAQAVEPEAAQRGLRVVVRPHPLERTQVTARHGEAVGRVRIDHNIDLYTSLRSARAVVSEVSTGVFEAVGLVDRIFIWDTPKARFGYPTHPFQTFTTPAMLLDLIDRPDSGRLAAEQVHAIWAPDWRAGYLSYLRAHGVRCDA